MGAGLPLLVESMHPGVVTWAKAVGVRIRPGRDRVEAPASAVVLPAHHRPNPSSACSTPGNAHRQATLTAQELRWARCLLIGVVERLLAVREWHGESKVARQSCWVCGSLEGRKLVPWRSPRRIPSGTPCEGWVLLRATPCLKRWSKVVVRSGSTDVAATGYVPYQEGNQMPMCLCRPSSFAR